MVNAPMILIREIQEIGEMLVTCKDGKIEVGWTKMRKELNYFQR